SIKLKESDAYYLESNRGYGVSLPIIKDGLNINMHLDKYRYFYPDVMNITITSPLAFTMLKVSIQDIDSKEIVHTSETTEQNLSIPLEQDWGDELRVIAEIELDKNIANSAELELASFNSGESSPANLDDSFNKITLVANALHSSSVGKVSHLGTYYPLGGDIVIPVYVTVKKQ
ncbi:hypothetical protein C1141_20935, partial [Vibrio agarivorans]